VLARAAIVNPKLNAFLRVDADLARDAARLADAELAKGRRAVRCMACDGAKTVLPRRRALDLRLQDQGRASRGHDASALGVLMRGAIQFGVLHMRVRLQPDGPQCARRPCRNPGIRAHHRRIVERVRRAVARARRTQRSLGYRRSIRLPAAFNGITGLKVTTAA